MYLSGKIFKYIDCRMKKGKQVAKHYIYAIVCVKTGEIKKATCISIDIFQMSR